jgi:hypothetical protein
MSRLHRLSFLGLVTTHSSLAQASHRLLTTDFSEYCTFRFSTFRFSHPPRTSFEEYSEKLSTFARVTSRPTVRIDLQKMLRKMNGTHGTVPA